MVMVMQRWNVSPKEAVAIQRELRDKVRIEPYEKVPHLVAGCDISFNRFSDVVFAGFVVMTWPDMEVVEIAAVKERTAFPYVPGLLSFREIPSLLQAWERITHEPELLFVDGVGIAHPRRLGIATHLGLALDLPTIGCAKSVLTGSYAEPGMTRGSRSPLTDPRTGEVLGTVLRTKDNVKPMFVSPGYRTDVETSASLVLEAGRKHRMPEPTRQAHLAMNAFRLENRGS